MSVRLTDKEVDDLLSELCRQYGFCVPGDEIERLATNPPTDIEEFTAQFLQRKDTVIQSPIGCVRKCER